MKHITIIIVMMLLSAVVYANTPLGLTLRMKGDVALTRNETTTPLAEGGTLFSQDNIRTREESFAFIKFVDDGATLRVFENSVLTINTEKDGNRLHKTTNLQVGSVFTSVRKNKGDLTVETPTTVASVKGTDGFVVVSPDGKTIVIVIKGSYDVYNKTSGRAVTVTAGNSCSSDGTGSLNTYPTTDVNQDWLDDIKDDSMEESDIFRIELIKEDGSKKIIEVELE